MKRNVIYNSDCLSELMSFPDNSVDLIVTDPPYLIENINAGGSSQLCKELNSAFMQLEDADIRHSYPISLVLDELVRVMKNINIYIWCNKAQILEYLNYFNKLNSSFDILVWSKTNALPTFNNKYLSDKEYCLYFRKNGYCQPDNYKLAKTIFNHPINIKDKVKYGHPTIKPLHIIETLIMNSSKEGDLVLDPFAGSGTTGIACVKNKRDYILIEKSKKYCDVINKRFKMDLAQTNLF